MPKIDDLRILCSYMLFLPDIICVVETWLDDTIDDSEICVQGYCVHRSRVDHNRHGGGVLIYVKTVFNCCVLYS